MEGGSEEDGGVQELAGNWRSALVVNGLHDALAEAERQRDEMAHMLRYPCYVYLCFCYAPVCA